MLQLAKKNIFLISSEQNSKVTTKTKKSKKRTNANDIKN
jgi:hypothetical protein